MKVLLTRLAHLDDGVPLLDAGGGVEVLRKAQARRVERVISVASARFDNVVNRVKFSLISFASHFLVLI